jgi:hypothetical protein
MTRPHTHSLIAAALLFALTGGASAQEMRRRSPDGANAPPTAGASRDPRFPYAGVWAGTRTMPMGSDDVGFRFTVTDGKYSGATLHPDGGTAPQNNLALTAAGLTWEQPNSGGGTWVFNVRLAAPDSMVGTLVLRDAPANFTTVPKGTMVLTRQPVARAK